MCHSFRIYVNVVKVKLAHSGYHTYQVFQRTHFFNLLHLVKEVLQCKVIVSHFLSHFHSLFFIIGFLSLFNERKDISHSEYSGSHSVRVKRLKIFHFFTHTDILYGLTCYASYRKRRTASGIAVKLCKNNTVYSKLSVKAVGYSNCVLSCHSVYNKKYFLRSYRFFNIFQFLHQFFINMKTSGSIYQNYVVFIFCRILQ